MTNHVAYYLAKKRKSFVLFIISCLSLSLSLSIGACSDLIKVRESNLSDSLTVAAAVSLTDAFKEITNAFEHNYSESKVNLNFAASGLLQKQIEQGAPIDIFSSAAEAPMNFLEKQSLIISTTRKIFARNQLVVVVPKGEKKSIKQFSDLGDINVNLVAIGNPATVPAGFYSKEALEENNLYEQLNQERKLVFGENVRQVLTYVEQHNVAAAIVYATDAAISEKVEIVLRIPPEVTSPINYPIAIATQSSNLKLATNFINFVISPQGQNILRKYDFLPVNVDK